MFHISWWGKQVQLVPGGLWVIRSKSQKEYAGDVACVRLVGDADAY